MNSTQDPHKRPGSSSPQRRSGFRGTIDGLSLADMLQLFNQNRRSLTLEIECASADVYPHSRRVTIHLEDGEVVHAISGELQGRDALRLALSSPAGWIRTRPAENCGQTIRGPLTGLLLDLVPPDFEEKTVEVQYAYGAAPASGDGSGGGASGGSGGNGGANGNGSADRKNGAADKKRLTGPVAAAPGGPPNAEQNTAQGRVRTQGAEFEDDFSEGGVDYVGRADATETETVSMSSLTHANVQSTPSGSHPAVGSGLHPAWSAETLSTRDVLPPPPPPETSRLLAVLLGIALALTMVATVLVAVWLLRGPGSLTGGQVAQAPEVAQPAAPPAAAPRQPDQPAGSPGRAAEPASGSAAAGAQPETRPKTWRVLVSTVPADLELVDADTKRSLGHSPAEIAFDSPNSRVMIQAKRGRRLTQPIAITADQPQVTLDLRRWTARRRAPRSATPPATRVPTARRGAPSGPPAVGPKETPSSETVGSDNQAPAIGLIEDDEPALDLIDE